MEQRLEGRDPFRFDSTNLFEQVGKEKLIQLSTAFYTRVYNSENEAMRNMFHAHTPDMNEAIQNQYEFFIQRFGGEPLYSQRKGHPALRYRHASFSITEEMVELWLTYMEQALDEVGLEGEVRSMIFDFLTHTGYFLQNIDKDGNRLWGGPK